MKKNFFDTHKDLCSEIARNLNKMYGDHQIDFEKVLSFYEKKGRQDYIDEISFKTVFI